MSDTSAALSLVSLLTPASAAASTATLASAKSTSQDDTLTANAFLSLVTAAPVLTTDNKQKSDLPGQSGDQDQKSDGTSADTTNQLVAALVQQLNTAPAAQDVPLTQDDKDVLVAAATAEGKALTTAGLSDTSADDAADKGESTTNPTQNQPGAATSTSDAKAGADSNSAKKTAAEVPVLTTSPSQSPTLETVSKLSLQSNPVSILAQARKSVEDNAANSGASNNKSDALATATKLIAPEAARTVDNAAPSNLASAPTLAKFTGDHGHSGHAPSDDLQSPKPQSPISSDSALPSKADASAAQSSIPPTAAVKADLAANSSQDVNPASAQPATQPQLHERAGVTMTVVRADTHGAQHSLPVADIALTVARQFRQGVNRFEIRLDPPELGRIDVRLDLGHGGRATATLTVDRPETLQLLTRDSRALEQTLQDAGVKTDAGSLNFALRDQNGRQNPQAHDNAEAASTSETKAPENPNVVALTATIEPGRLDMRI